MFPDRLALSSVDSMPSCIEISLKSLEKKPLIYLAKTKLRLKEHQ